MSSSGIDHSFNRVHSIDHGRTRSALNNVSPQPRIQFNGNMIKSREESQITRSVSEGKSKIMGLPNVSILRKVESRPNTSTNSTQSHPIINPLNYIQPYQLQSQYIQSSQHPPNPQVKFNSAASFSVNTSQNPQIVRQPFNPSIIQKE